MSEPAKVAEFDQALARVRELPPLLCAYRQGLLEGGFTPKRAFKMCAELQSELIDRIFCGEEIDDG